MKTFGTVLLFITLIINRSPLLLWLAILLSVMGDLYFVWHPTKYMIPAILFSLAHLCYAHHYDYGQSKNYIVGYLLAIWIMQLMSRKHRSNYNIIKSYTVVIVTVFLIMIENEARGATAGYLLFILSDILLFVKDFWRPYNYDQQLVLITYYTAQLILIYYGS
jgi:uncharacterized membrane protein YhhN